MTEKPVFAQVVSAMFHPILWVFYMLTFLTFLYRSDFKEANAVVIFLLVSFFLSVVMPSIMMWILFRFKMISSLQLAERSERILPLFVVGVSYFITYQLYSSMMLPAGFQLIFKGATYLVFVCMVITLFWKISLHMLSIGATIGFLMAIGLHYEWLFPQIILPIFLIAGVVGYARLKLQAHTPAQIYVGFLAGWLLLFVGFFFL